jgi:hypothetical protein
VLVLVVIVIGGIGGFIFHRRRRRSSKPPTPPALKDKMQLEEKKALQTLNKIPDKDYQRYENGCYNLTRALLDELFTMLYQEDIGEV